MLTGGTDCTVFSSFTWMPLLMAILLVLGQPDTLSKCASSKEGLGCRLSLRKSTLSLNWLSLFLEIEHQDSGPLPKSPGNFEF